MTKRNDRLIARAFSPVPALLAAAMIVLAVPAGGAWADSGLPVPRFVTLRSSEVNVRTGPGSRYPVEWVYTRPGLPVEVIAEFDTWRRIRDHDGVEGWVFQPLLSGRRGALVTGTEPRPVRSEPRADAPLVARAEPGVVGRLLRCPPSGAFCQVQFEGYRGWMARSDFWGAYPDETVE